jgi:transposase
MRPTPPAPSLNPADPDTVRADRNRKMVSDWRGGASVTQIAQRYGLSLNWTGTVLRQNGAELPVRGRGVKREVDAEQVAAAYRGGATIRQLAGVHAVSYGTIHHLLQQQHVPMRPRGGGQRAE